MNGMTLPRDLDLFRAEALDHHGSRSGSHGDPLRLLPEWIRWTYPALIGMVACGVVFVSLFHVHLYASGPSVVRVLGRSDVTSPVSGIVDSILVSPGEQVSAGQLIVRLDSVEQQAELDRIRREFEEELANHLRDLLDPTAIRQLSALRTQLEFARRMRDLRCLRAPRAGTVADIRTQVGQQLLSGQVAATVRASAEQIHVLAALPGKFRPMLRRGLPAWLELQGYAHDHCKVVLQRVDVGVIGPKEATRYFGPEVGDVMALSGPIVLVNAFLPRSTFTADGKTYSYHDGMQGRLQVRVRSEAMILALVPGLRILFEHRDE